MLFIIWLAMKNVFKNGDRLLKWGFQGDVKCDRHVEDRNHFCLGNSQSWRIWINITSLCTVKDPPICLEDVVEEGLLQWKRRVFKAYTCRLALGSTVYHIWRNRNALKYDNHPLFEYQLLQKIKWDVRVRLMGKGKLRKTKGNVDICYRWGIDPNILVQFNLF